MPEAKPVGARMPLLLPWSSSPSTLPSSTTSRTGSPGEHGLAGAPTPMLAASRHGTLSGAVLRWQPRLLHKTRSTGPSFTPTPPSVAGLAAPATRSRDGDTDTPRAPASPAELALRGCRRALPELRESGSDALQPEQPCADSTLC